MALRKQIFDSSRPRLPAGWRLGLTELTDGTVTLRELRETDAASLAFHLHRPSVLQYIAPCPATTFAFTKFIRWADRERRRGKFACYGIVPSGHATAAVGVIQVWPIERDFSTAEWGFVIGQDFWRRGVFGRAARLALDTLFFDVGVYRLEARVVDANIAGNRALERLGAKRDGILRGGFRDRDVVRDHVMWSILAPEWPALRTRGRRGH